jgi:hypothetical protein
MKMIEDSKGDIIDAEYFCSDFCHQDAAGDSYQGWYGCVEISTTQTCENPGCEEILNGIEDEDEDE